MPDSPPPPVVEEKAHTLSDVFEYVVLWLDGFSGAVESILIAVIAGVILALLSGIVWLLRNFFRWLFVSKKDVVSPAIHIHPQITVEIPKAKESVAEVAPEILKSKIHSDRLPTVKGEFFGRVDELQLLNDAWAGNGTRVIQFIAPGGTGKTKLLRHWLDHTDNIDGLIAWSFYSQGASEDKQISATPFFSYAFDKLGSTRDVSSFKTDEDKGEHLADLLRQQRAVLVLDGLEPLQHASKGMRGELKDRAVRQLLKSLAGQWSVHYYHTHCRA